MCFNRDQLAISIPSTTPSELRMRARAWFSRHTSCAVAFSGGVDSALVLALALETLGPSNVFAFTAESASLPKSEREFIVSFCSKQNVRLHLLQTSEFQNPQYVRNTPDRCYHCKHTLYSELRDFLSASNQNSMPIFDGTNSDDIEASDRPGLRAAAEHRILHPLAELGMRKSAVRELARELNLPVWDKPSSPCLSSRVPHGTAVTPALLALIDQAEAAAHLLNFRVVRVRIAEIFPALCARVEIGSDEEHSPAQTNALCAELIRLGFSKVEIDHNGYRVGGANSPLVKIREGRQSSAGRISPSQQSEPR